MTFINAYAVPGLKREKKALFQATPENITRLICEITGITWEKITGSRGRDKVLIARFFVCYFLFKYTILNKSDIGKLIYRDHTTIINALWRLNNLVETNDYVRETINVLTKTIESNGYNKPLK